MSVTNQKVFWAPRDESLYAIVRPELVEEIQHDGVGPGWHCTCDLYHDGLDIRQACESPVHVVSHQIAADYIVSEHVREDYYAMFSLNPRDLRGSVSRVMTASPVAPFLRQLDPREPIAPRCLELVGCFGAAPINGGWFPAKEEASEAIRKVAIATAARWEALCAEAACLREGLDGALDVRRDQFDDRQRRGFQVFLEWLYDAGLPTSERADGYSDTASSSVDRLDGETGRSWFMRLVD